MIQLPKPLAFCRWLLLFYGVSFAQPNIASIEFVGNSIYSDRELLEIVPLKIDTKFTSTDACISSLINFYHGEGYYSITVDSIIQRYSIDSADVRLTVFLQERNQIVLGDIRFSGNTRFTADQLASSMETSLKAPLSPSVLENDIHQILGRYSASGFPFTVVKSDSIHMIPGDSSQLVLQLHIEEGPFVMVDEITVEGNTVTSKNVVAREAYLQPNEAFNAEKLEKIRRRLERLQFFSSVSLPELYISSHGKEDSLRGGLLITVQEGNTNTFDGIIGYVPPPTPNVQGYFTGNIFIAMRNLFGTGRRGMIKWQRESAVTQELELQYREPWLFGIPMHAGGSYYQRKQDSSYIKSRIDTKGEFTITEELSFAGNLSSESVYPSATLQQFTVFESQTIFIGGEILYDTRDNVRNPTSGIRYSTSVLQGKKSITGPETYIHLAAQRNFSMRKYTLDADFFFPTFLRQVIAVGVHGKYVGSTQLEQSDLFQFGGTTTLRGYRENQFFASQITYINSEYRFLTGRASSLFGFIDGGYYTRPADPLKGIPRQERMLYGYGIGARVETELGIININYALAENESISNGKIHIGINNEF